MIACCYETPTDWAAWTTALGTCALALITLILFIAAYIQIKDIKRGIKRYTFSIFLQQEDKLLDKQNEIKINIIARNKLLPTPPIKDETYINFELYTKWRLQEQEIQTKISNYLYALDGYSYLILKEHFPEIGSNKPFNEEVSHYKLFFNNAISFLDGRLTSDNTSNYKFITELQNKI